MSEWISAPGKVFLAGEYAVLEPGRPALVVGVDRRLHASRERVVRVVQLVQEPGRHVPVVQLVHRPSGLIWEPPALPPPELRFAARAALLCRAEGLRLVFENDLALEGAKIGLGASAAACVLTVRAARPGATDEAVLALAAAAHWAEQGGQGSGADVAACALGGVLEVRSRFPWRSAEEVMALSPEQIASSRPVEARRVRAPADLRLALAFSGKSADTRALLKPVRELMQGDPRRWKRLADRISAASESLRVALEAGDGDGALDAVRAGAAAMAALGEEVKAPIVTEELARACALAAAAGAAAKPSGAGGGDCAVVVAFGEKAMQRAEAALRPHFPVFRVTPA